MTGGAAGFGDAAGTMMIPDELESGVTVALGVSKVELFRVALANVVFH